LGITVAIPGTHLISAKQAKLRAATHSEDKRKQRQKENESFVVLLPHKGVITKVNNTLFCYAHKTNIRP
jgi:hypothetical protein